MTLVQRSGSRRVSTVRSSASRSARALALVAGLGVVACGEPTSPGAKPAVISALPRALSASESAIANSTPSFGVNLLREVNRSYADSNVFLSPLSASMALAMTMNGANGTTYTQMREALGLPDQPLADLNAGYQSLITMLRGLDGTVDFRLANSIWYANSFAPFIAPTFLTDTRTFFDARVTGLDFQSPQAPSTINAWVNTSTNGKIDRIVDAIPSNIVMYLINATYFKGAWRDGFAPSATTSSTFTTATGARVSVPMMTRKGGFRARMGNGVEVGELPYGGDAYVMTLVMPPVGQSINAFVASLTASSWASLVSGLNDVTWDIYLPKFTLRFEDKLNDELQALGMRQAFIAGGADFTRLSPTAGRDLYISDVKQKTFVDVNEVGTEAAAVTSVGIGVTSLPPSIRFDRPFVFAIRERLSGTVLFMGKIVRP